MSYEMADDESDKSNSLDRVCELAVKNPPLENLYYHDLESPPKL